MSDFFDKISTLINAQFNDLLGKNPRSPLARIKLNAEEAEKNPQRSAHSLRLRLEEAIEYEDELEARIDERMTEVAELDKLVDEMLRSGDGIFGAALARTAQHETAASVHRRIGTPRPPLDDTASDARTCMRSRWRSIMKNRRGRALHPRLPAGKTRIPIDGIGAHRTRRRGNVKRSFVDAVS